MTATNGPTVAQTDIQRERENSNTLMLKDSSGRSIWTYLTASPCYTTNRDRQTDRQTERGRETDSDCIVEHDQGNTKTTESLSVHTLPFHRSTENYETLRNVFTEWNWRKTEKAGMNMGVPLELLAERPDNRTLTKA